MATNHQPEDDKKFGAYDILILIISIYVLVSLTITTFCQMPKQTKILLGIIDNFVCLLFLIDFIRDFRNAPNKLKFMRWGWIDLIASIPTIGIFRYGRLLKLIRLIRVLRAFRSTEIIVRYIFKSKFKGTMISVLLLTILVIIFSSIAILHVENAPTSNIKTASDALWWTVETITTIGYGDKYPVTDLGRVIGTILMISGVGLFGTYTAYIASLFVKSDNKRQHEADDDE